MSQKLGLVSAAPLEKQGLRRKIFLWFGFSLCMLLFSILNMIVIFTLLCICRGFQLPVSYVIHTVGPIYETNSDPEAFLKSAYRYIYIYMLCIVVRLAAFIASRMLSLLMIFFWISLCPKFDFSNSLKVAKENNVQYVAFPAISCGVYG